MVPLLCRMSNLENLYLYFAFKHLPRFLDGYALEKDIISHLPRLNKFVFNIRSIISLDNQISLPSNDDIQCTFANFTNNKIISCVDYFPKANIGQCHIFSHPYTTDYYDNITNNFPGGLFKCIRKISLFDESPFEHEFFIGIA
jgi:hypothetical protein